MKLLFTTIIFSLTSLINAATTNPQDCMRITNTIDRKYCVDKYLETLKDKMNAEKQSWANGLNQNDKAAKSSAVEQEIQMKKDYAALLASEVALTETHLAELKNVAVVTPVSAPAKKKKKKGGFRIKL
jgi:hypothetical protein